MSRPESYHKWRGDDPFDWRVCAHCGSRMKVRGTESARRRAWWFALPGEFIQQKVGHYGKKKYRPVPECQYVGLGSRLSRA